MRFIEEPDRKNGREGPVPGLVQADFGNQRDRLGQEGGGAVKDLHGS
jgi:hypothetical protein